MGRYSCDCPPIQPSPYGVVCEGRISVLKRRHDSTAVATMVKTACTLGRRCSHRGQSGEHRSATAIDDIGEMKRSDSQPAARWGQSNWLSGYSFTVK
jgi:hypothetical protein